MMRLARRTSARYSAIVPSIPSVATLYSIQNAFRSIDLGRAPAHVVVDGLLDSLAATVMLMLVALSGVALYELFRDRGNDDDAA
jgi:biopolymer transport protein ExbB/TolQ